jgi:hypothetical protein
MGADGGYYFFKRSELEQPPVLRRMQNWFIRDHFNWSPQKGWTLIEYGDYREYRYHEHRNITMDEWLAKHGLNKVEDINLEFIVNYLGTHGSIISAGSFPGLSEDLVRISYGDNIHDGVNYLIDFITRGFVSYWYKNELPNYFTDIEYWTDEERNIWSWCEETWT